MTLLSSEIFKTPKHIFVVTQMVCQFDN